MITFREYRFLNTLNEVSTERKKETTVAKKENGEIINVGISVLKKKLPKYSEDIIYTTLLILDDRGLITAGYTNPMDEGLIMFNMEKAGRVAIYDYPKDLFFCIAKNFLIPVVASGFFAALFTCILTA